MKRITLLLAFVLILSVPSYATTITVPDNYETIQEAIGGSNIGDIVLVMPGTYEETLRIEKGITLRGYDREDTIIDGMGSDYAVYGIVPDITIENLTITNAQIGIELEGADNFVVLNCTIRDCKGGVRKDLYGIKVRDCTNGRISTNSIFNLQGGYDGRMAGVYCYNVSNLIIEKNQIFSLKGGEGGLHGYSARGIEFVGSSSQDCKIINNLIYKLQGGEGWSSRKSKGQIDIGLGDFGGQFPCGHGGNGGGANGITLSGNRMFCSNNLVGNLFGGDGGLARVGGCFPEGRDGSGGGIIGLSRPSNYENTTIVNNIFFNFQGGFDPYGVQEESYVFLGDSDWFPGSNPIIDHNCYYEYGTSIFREDLVYDSGPHSFETDPLFVDPENGDFRLQPNSFCIDSGTALLEVFEDILGVTRPQGLGFDIGPYEWVEGSLPPTPIPTPTLAPDPDPTTGKFRY